MKHKFIIKTGLFIFAFLFFITSLSYSARIKDLTSIKGIRKNQLIGYGLVVGLEGSGDGSSQFTLQALSNMMESMGISVDKSSLKSKNVAAVMVTSEMPPFARMGSKLDVTLSSVGDAKSLEGGTLLLTPLKGVNGKVYALAQGQVAIGSYGDGNDRQKHSLVARISGGAIVEKEIPVQLKGKKKLTLVLKRPDFTTVSRITKVINKAIGSDVASTLDSGAINLSVPENYINKIPLFIANIEKLDVKPDTIAKVVINEKTGTVVMGTDVKISSIAISHGNIAIEIKSPNEEESSSRRRSKKDTKYKRVFVMSETTTIGDLAKALNSIGIMPQDLITIFQTIKAAGALQAELEII